MENYVAEIYENYKLDGCLLCNSEKIEALYGKYGMDVLDHFAQDGATPHFAKKVDTWNEEQFKIWCDYHYSICRQKSLLGASNHAVIIGRK